MSECPRCKKEHYNSIWWKRCDMRVPVNKCKVCGFVWIDDDENLALSKKELEQLFLKDVMNIGRNTG